MKEKQLWILVGGNGAGKSTFYQQRLKPLGLPFVNADNIAREVFPEEPERRSYEAAQIAERLRLDEIAKGKSFCFETVFSHPSKIDFLAHAKAMGYTIYLVFIHVNDVALNKARISQRVQEGGHYVPEDKVESRIPRTLDNVKAAIPLCDYVKVIDNSSVSDPFVPVLTIKAGERIAHMNTLPLWAEPLVS